MIKSLNMDIFYWSLFFYAMSATQILMDKCLEELWIFKNITLRKVEKQIVPLVPKMCASVLKPDYFFKFLRE